MYIKALIRIIYLACLFICLLPATIQAQNFEEYSLPLADFKVTNSLYSNIKLLDLRKDTSNLGFVQRGLSNKKSTLIPKGSLQQQVQAVLTAMIDTSAKANDLLLRIRRFDFSELTTKKTENGFFNLNAAVYVKKENGYHLLNAVDTALIISAVDVTKTLLDKGGQIFFEFLAAYLAETPRSVATYSPSQIADVDSIDRLSMKLYFTSNYTDGVYSNYSAFRRQVPSQGISVDGDTVNKSNVKSLNRDGKFSKIKPADIYAIVYKGTPYIATPFGFYKLMKSENEFTFRGKIGTATVASTAIAGMMFGVVGSLIASNANATFEAKIDPLTGIIVAIREIPDPPSIRGY